MNMNITRITIKNTRVDEPGVGYTTSTWEEFVPMFDKKDDRIYGYIITMRVGPGGRFAIQQPGLYRISESALSEESIEKKALYRVKDTEEVRL